MSVDVEPDPTGRAELAVGWGAVLASVAAVAAWATCCVLPLALSVGGLGLAGWAWIAGQRWPLTLIALVALAAGWWSVRRRRQACALDANCPPPSRLMIGLLTAASTFTFLALIWTPVLEPNLLAMLRSFR